MRRLSWPIAGAAFMSTLLYAVYQGGSLAWHLFGFEWVLAVVVVISQSGPLSAIEVQRRIGPGPYFAGDPLHVTVLVQSSKRWLWPHLALIDRLPPEFDTTDPKFLVNQLTTEIPLRYQVPALRRGVHELREVTVTTGDLFGLTRRTRRVAVRSRLVVWPSTVALTGTHLFSRMWRGENLAPQPTRQDSTHLRGIREYVPGDRLSHVHWKTSAHTGEFKVKQFEPETKPEFMVVLESARYFSASEWELAVSVAASLVRFAQKSREAIGLATVDQPQIVYGPGLGQTHVARMMNLLASLEQAASASATKLPPIEARQVVIGHSQHLDRWVGRADIVIGVGPGGLAALADLPALLRPRLSTREGGDRA